MTRRLGILLGAVLVAVLLSMRSFPRTSADVTGQKNVIVLRAYFHDYTATSRYSLPQVQGFFGDLNTLWGTRNSYGKMGLSAQVTDLIQYPSNRSAYIDDFSTGDLSNGGKFDLVLDDAIANSPAGLDWSDVDAVMVVMSETDPAQFHRGQAGTCTKKMGPAANAPLKYVGCAIFSENPSQSDLQVWGRWAHEVGHAFQEGNPPHPSNYNSSFELMDDNMPGQTGMFEKWIPGGFGGWMPHAKYKVFTPTTGGGTAAIYAEEYDPATRPNAQAVKADVTGSLYYIVSVRRRINGDELNGDFQSGPVGTRGIPDEGVLIERVVENGDGAVAGSPWVVLQGKGGDRDKLWHEGDQYQNTSDGVYITVDKKFDDDDYQVTVRYSDGSAQPDVGLYSWLSPPGNTYETTDIWIDSPINGYDTFRYGMWSDLHGGTVPKGNGDDPGVGQANRLYARVRNLGTLTATNVVVHFDVTDPPGLGINGSNGFVQLGTVTSAQFPGLASIAAGGFTDVYIDWVPDFTVTPAQLAAGRFAFHTCVRVRLDHLPNEKVFGNQDGDGQQENVGYFEATQGPGAPPGAPYTNVIRLRNDDRVSRKYFYLKYKSDVPKDWVVDINGGKLGVELLPDEVRDIPVVIKQTSSQPYGKVFGVDVIASSQRLLVNDKDPRDVHPEFKTLGGTRIETHVVAKVKLDCSARRTGEGIEVTGRLSELPERGDYADLPVLIEGVGADRKFIRGSAQLLHARGNSRFRGRLRAGKQAPRAVVCLFSGTQLLASASSGFVPIR